MNLHSFKNNILVKILMFPVMLSLSGCIYLVVGGIGAVGGYVISPDTVEGITQSRASEAWDAAMEVVSIMGTIEERSDDVGFIVAKVNGAKVTVTLISLGDSTVKLNVKARKFGFPKISTAQNVFVKIMSYLNE